MADFNDKIWLSPPFLAGREKEYAIKAIDSNWIAPTGPFVDEFENSISKFTQSKYTVACSSGTAAIHLCLKALKVKEGDYIACSSFTFAGSAFPILYENAKPVFIDSEKHTWNMCPVLLEKAIRELERRKERLKAIIVVHLFGMPAHMKAIMKIARKYNISVIEDAAEALGSWVENKHVGIIGDLGILSFNGNKIVTTSGGGAVISRKKKMEKRIRKYADQSKEANLNYYQHYEIGYNYRFSNILAAIGLGQMENLKSILKKKRKVFQYYKHALKGVNFQKEPEGFLSNYWLTVILFSRKKKRDLVLKKLQGANIDARLPWKPMHMQPVFKKALVSENGTSKAIFNRGLCLPSGTGLSNKELKRISALVNSV